jgi:hypothetical protein
VEALPTVSGDVRDTFDAPMRGEAEVAARTGSGARVGEPARSATATTTASKPIGDARALFEDNPKARERRLSPAEARKQARRCPTCSSVVPVGMSICSRCGLDLESGTRVSLEDDLAPPRPPRPTLPLPIGIIGGVCLMGSVILTITTLSLWLRGYDGFHYFVPVCAFGIFAAVQFLRLKSTKLLLMALTFGLAIDVIALIAMPIYRANSDTGPVQRTGPVNDPDQADVIIPSVVDKLDSQSLAVGIGLIVVYAGVSVYLISPQARRHFR